MTGHSIPETQEDTRCTPSLPSVGGQETGQPPTNTMENTCKYPAEDYQQLVRLRATNTPPNQLCGCDRKSVCIFYNSFVDFNQIYRILLKILDDVQLDRLDEEDENVYPRTGLRKQEPQLYDDYCSAIYARLEEDGFGLGQQHCTQSIGLWHHHSPLGRGSPI